MYFDKTFLQIRFFLYFLFIFGWCLVKRMDDTRSILEKYEQFYYSIRNAPCSNMMNKQSHEFEFYLPQFCHFHHYWCWRLYLKAIAPFWYDYHDLKETKICKFHSTDFNHWNQSSRRQGENELNLVNNIIGLDWTWLT